MRINGFAILPYQLSGHQHSDFITGHTMECMLLREKDTQATSHSLRLNKHFTQVAGEGGAFISGLLNKNAEVHTQMHTHTNIYTET